MDKTLSRRVIEALLSNGKTLATAESCTGGLVGKLLTDVPGSSAAYLGGVISYTNGVKHNLLGVPQDLLDTVGPVSEETAQAMCEGARAAIGADLGVSVTGLAGPGGDGSGKPVGLVYVGVTDGMETAVFAYTFPGGRRDVREQAAEAALTRVLSMVNCEW